MKYLFIVGIIILSLVTMGSLGYGLYLWGGVGLALPVAAWSAFKLYMIGSAIGLVSLLLGIYK